MRCYSGLHLSPHKEQGAKAMMMRVLLVLGLLLSCCPSARAARNLLEPKVLGFTADGRTFLYVVRDSGTVRADNEIRAVGIDVQTGRSHEYFDSLDETDSPERIAFRKWLKNNPARCLGGPRSPDGRYMLRVQFRGTDGIRGQWQRQRYLFGDSQDQSDTANPWGHLGLWLVQGHNSRQLHKWELRAEWRLAGGMIPCWSPDGQRLAVVRFREGQGMRDEGEMFVGFYSLGSEMTWEFPPLRP